MNDTLERKERKTHEEFMRELEQDAAIDASPAVLKHGRDHSPTDDGSGVVRQRCGGGFRVIMKRIGSN